jgi:hypothetical protein
MRQLGKNEKKAWKRIVITGIAFLVLFAPLNVMIHESIHLGQFTLQGKPILGFSLLGYQKMPDNSTALGWVTTSGITKEEMREYEAKAYFGADLIVFALYSLSLSLIMRSYLKNSQKEMMT